VISVFRISDLTLDLSQGRLFGPSGDIPVRAKSFALLAHMVRNEGIVLSKEALMSAIWPDVIVTEDSLTQCVHDIRRALGDRDAKFLRTVPRRGYMFALPDQPNATANPPNPGLNRSSGPHPGSIAVLPLLGPPEASPEDRIIFDGLIDDVISHLARLRNFQVISRGSTFSLRHLAADPMSPAKLLNTAFVVSGSFKPQQSGFLMRLDLTRCSDGVILWTDDLPLSLADVLERINSITDRIVNAVATEITATETRRALAAPESSLDAWQAYHRGLGLVFTFDPDMMRRAREYFAMAVRLDPGFARAHAGVSFCHYFLAFSGLGADREGETQSALRHAERAMQADSSDPNAQWSYGRALWLNHDADAGLDHALEATRLSPSFAQAHYMVGFMEAHKGDAMRSLQKLNLAEALSPMDPFLASIHITRALALIRLGRVDEAANWARSASRKENTYSQLLGLAAMILAAAGREDDARKLLTPIRKQDPKYSVQTLLRSLYILPQDVQDVLRQGAARIGIPET
jgi:DNA-binding winged helix-turn-helix (wHTH) protein/tetratricopeptide (TPR) repeat protein